MHKLSFILLLFFPIGSATLQAAPQQGPAQGGAVLQAETIPDAADASRLIHLQGALNARDLSGLKTSAGVVTSNRFVRTADLSHLTASDKTLLHQRQVQLDIDLRTTDEASSSPDALAADSRFKYLRISLLGEQRMDAAHMPHSLAALYVNALAQNQAQFRTVFEAMAAQADGTILFHCTAGKDRTGMISAMLLALAGVSEDTIVHNYAISAYYLKPMLQTPKMQAMVRKNPAMAALLGTPPQAIETFLTTLHNNYGGVEAYLRTIGVSPQAIRQLRARMLAHATEQT